VYLNCCNTMTIKRLSDISIESGSVDCLFTFVIRIDKRRVPDEVIKDIKTNGILLRLNEEPLSIDKDYKNVTPPKDGEDVYVITIRDQFKIKFLAELLYTPFDRFALPFKVELSSKKIENYSYSFNCLINLIDSTSNLSIKSEANLLAGFKIDYEKSVAVIKEDFKN